MHSKIVFSKRNIIVNLFALSTSLLEVTRGQMLYPFHLGGFSGDTDVQGFTFDSGGNLAVTGYTTDIELATAPG